MIPFILRLDAGAPRLVWNVGNSIDSSNDEEYFIPQRETGSVAKWLRRDPVNPVVAKI